MGVARSFYRVPDRADFIELSRLLGEPQSEDLLQTWDAGEWHFAIEFLADQLSDGHVPVVASQRALLLRLAERYEVAEYVTSSLRWCPDPDVEQPWESIDGTQRATAAAAELAIEIPPGHALAGVTLVPWLACMTCDDVLVTVHANPTSVLRDPHTFAVIHPTWSGRQERLPWPKAAVFPQALPALDRLESCGTPSHQGSAG